LASRASAGRHEATDAVDPALDHGLRQVGHRDLRVWNNPGPPRDADESLGPTFLARNRRPQRQNTKKIMGRTMAYAGIDWVIVVLLVKIQVEWARGEVTPGVPW